MRWLGIEASTRDISLAFLSGSVAVERRAGPATASPSGRASEAIPRLLARLRSHVGWRMTDLSAVAVSRGPGSFTGIRMGLAAARAFGMALGIPVVGVPTLEGLAQAAGRTGLVVTVLDALRGEVYVAAYRVAGTTGGSGDPPLRRQRRTNVRTTRLGTFPGSPSGVRTTIAPSRCAVDRLGDLVSSKLGPAAEATWVAGDDEAFRALTAAGLGPVARVRPSALAVARIAGRVPARRAGPPAALYLRDPESVVRWKKQPSR